MKTLIIGNENYPIPSVDGGAVEKLVEDYLRYNEMSERRFDITVYSPVSKNINVEDNNKEFKLSKFRYINKKTLKYQAVRLIKKIYKILKGDNLSVEFKGTYISFVLKDLEKKKELGLYDIVIIENEEKFIIPVSKKVKGKLIFHLHNDHLNLHTKNAKELLDKCDLVMSVSNFISNRVKEIDMSANVVTLYNGIDIESFKKEITDEEKNKLLNKLKLNKEDKIILYTGRLMPEKGVLELIKAFNKLDSIEQQHIKLLIVGGCKNEKKECIDPYLKKLKKESLLNSNNILFTGKLPYNELRLVNKLAYVQVVPSIWNEPFGLTVIEGMATGNPMIVSNVGAIPEIVGNNSVLVIDIKKDIVNQLEISIKRILNDENLKNKLKDNAYLRVSNFSLANYCKNFEKFIYFSLDRR